MARTVASPLGSLVFVPLALCRFEGDVRTEKLGSARVLERRILVAIFHRWR